MAFPYQIRKWSKWALSIQSDDEKYANILSETLPELLALRASIKSGHNTDSQCIQAKLRKIDERLQSWEQNTSWQYTSSLVMDEIKASAYKFESRYDIYPDMCKLGLATFSLNGISYGIFYLSYGPEPKPCILFKTNNLLTLLLL